MGIIVAALLATWTMAADDGAAGPLPRLDRAPSHACGQAELFSRTFDVKTSGRPTSCKEARKVITGRCKIHLHRKWSCFSLRIDAPFIVWFPSKELFAKKWSRVIYYDRYPCSEAFVSSELFAREPRGFPSLRQLLADDLIRCDMLDGMSYEDVRQLLGAPDEAKPGRYLSYGLGAERDSVFQIDSEFLYVSFSKAHKVSDVEIYQG